MPREAFSESSDSEKEHLHQILELLNTPSFFDMPPERKKEIVGLAVETIRQAMTEIGGIYRENVNEVYEAASGQNLIVRRENPEILVETIAAGEGLELQLDQEVPGEYPNCALWRYDLGAQGLRNAFLEGHAQLGGLVTVVGFKKGAGLEITKVKPDNVQVETSDLDQNLVRIARGTVKPEDIEFVILRAPAGYLPENELTEQERAKLEKNLKDNERREPVQIFRGFAFNEAAEKLKEKTEKRAA
jgi:hypothetical protein